MHESRKKGILRKLAQANAPKPYTLKPRERYTAQDWADFHKDNSGAVNQDPLGQGVLELFGGGLPSLGRAAVTGAANLAAKKSLTAGLPSLPSAKAVRTYFSRQPSNPFMPKPPKDRTWMQYAKSFIPSASSFKPSNLARRAGALLYETTPGVSMLSGNIPSKFKAMGGKFTPTGAIRQQSLAKILPESVGMGDWSVPGEVKSLVDLFKEFGPGTSAPSAPKPAIKQMPRPATRPVLGSPRPSGRVRIARPIEPSTPRRVRVARPIEPSTPRRVRIARPIE